MKRSRWIALAAAALAVALVTAGTAAGAEPAPQQRRLYTVTPLVSDQPGVAPTHRSEPRQRLGHLGRADRRRGGSRTRAPTPRRCTTRPGTASRRRRRAARRQVPGGPTGTVFNGGDASSWSPTARRPVAARFIFATLAGTIQGWPAAAAAATVTAPTARSGAPSTPASRSRATGCTPPTSERPGRRRRRRLEAVKKPGAFTDP